MMFRLRAHLVVMTALAALLGAAGLASAPQNKLDLALRDGQALGQSQRVILQAAPGAELRMRQLLAARGTQIEAELPLVGAMTVTLSAADLVAVCEQSPLVRSCSIDGEVTSLGANDFRFGATRRSRKPAPSAAAASTLLGTLGLPYRGSGHGGLGGHGVRVALIDSGIDPTAFGGRVKEFRDFTNYTGGTPDATGASDTYGHGTHLAGLIGGSQNSLDAEYQGVAPGVEFVALKVLDQDGRGFTTDVIAAISFAVVNKEALGIDIINLSLGHPIYAPAAEDLLVQAVEKASEAGIIVVVSGGNFGADPKGKLGYAGITSPGNAPSAITVGAVDHKGTAMIDDNRVADYSSSGPTWYDGYAKPDVVAPGHYLASESAADSTLSKAHPELLVEGPSHKWFIHLSGTSMSTAVATGVVALLKEQRADLTPNLAKGLLQYTAIPLKNDRGRVYGRLRQGTGEVNAAGALALAGAIKQGIPTLDPLDDNTPATWWGPTRKSFVQSTQIGRRTYAWAGNIVWGNTVFYNLPIWGRSIVWGHNIAWGDNLVWGHGLEDGDNIVWGNNIVWGSNIVWGNHLVWTKHIVWGDGLLGVKHVKAADDQDNVVWGNFDEANIVWGNFDDDNIVWGNLFDDNIVWGNDDHNIVWGNVVLTSDKGDQ